jgi:hypothetical protein
MHVAIKKTIAQSVALSFIGNAWACNTSMIIDHSRGKPREIKKKRLIHERGFSCLKGSANKSENKYCDTTNFLLLPEGK